MNRRFRNIRWGRAYSVTVRRSLQVERLESRQLLAAISMTDREQLLLELINRARQNPGAEATKLGIDLNQGLDPGTIANSPKQPLAPNQLLLNAARQHSQDMLNNNYFAHINLQRKDAGQRINDAGYAWTGWGENLSWGGSTGTIDQVQQVYSRHESLFKSPGHRKTMLVDAFHEVGLGVRYGVFTEKGVNYNASMVTEKFAKSFNKVFITGVAFTDQIQRDSFYTIGEGIGSLTVVATSDSSRFETRTGPSGGYSLEVMPGTYTVTFSDGILAQPISFPNIVVQSENRKVDLIPSQEVKLQLSLSTSSIPEKGGTTAAVVSRTGLNTSSLTIQITSSNNARATVPTTVTIPAGKGSATFTIRAVDNSAIEGDQTVTIRASATGASSASVSLKIIDDEKAQLSISLSEDTMREIDGTISGTVSRNGPTTRSQVVSLTSSDRAEAMVPATVTIPANATSATFAIAAVHDNIADGPKTVTITASAAGHLSGSANLTVLDDDILVANEDNAITLRGIAVEIAVLQNDNYPSSPLADLTIEIATPPASSRGTVEVIGNQRLRFTPATTFVGIATMHYVVRDHRLGVSQPARVRVGVPASAKQNPWNPYDVNGDGRVAAHDVLLIINTLNNPNESRNVGDIRNPLRQPFVDVNGDGFINAVDALLVINHLNRRSQGEGEPNVPTHELGATALPITAADAAFHQTLDWLAWDWQDETRRRRRIM